MMTTTTEHPGFVLCAPAELLQGICSWDEGWRLGPALSVERQSIVC